MARPARPSVRRADRRADPRRRWGWVAWTFLLQRYATINWVAGYFAAAFAVEAALLFFAGVRGTMASESPRSRTERAALAVAALALAAYPLIAPAAGRPWTQAEVFGVLPDPTAAATLGFALLAPGGTRWLLLPIPLVWCAVGGATLWTMKSPDAAVLPLVALLILALAAVRPRR